MIDARLSLLVGALAVVTVASTTAAATLTPAAQDTDGRGSSVAAAGGEAARAPEAPADLPSPDRRSGAPRIEGGVYGPVTTVRPAMRIRDADDPVVLDQVRAVPGVAAVAQIRVGTVSLAGTSEVEVAAVDPATFRAFTPQPTADTVGVWQRIEDGEAAFTHGAAQTHGLDLGGYVDLGGPGVEPVRVGALASNGTPPVAGAIVGLRTGAALGLDRIAPTVLVGVATDADVSVVAGRVRQVTGATVEVIPDARVPTPVSTGQRPAAPTVWDALAMCESSGDWHMNSGNGFYGGLQFLPESWQLVGGAGMPHEASREEQIHRAQLLLAIQGWEAWPVCSVRLGLRPPPG